MRSTPRNTTITVSGVTAPYPPQDPSGWYTQPTPPPPPQHKSISTVAILAIVFGAIAVLGVAAATVGALVPDAKKPPATVQDDGAGSPAPYDALPGQPSPTASTAPGPLTSFADGTHEVGTGAGQIPPGTYAAVVPDQAFDFCMWSRLKGFSGEGKDTITFGTGNGGDKMRVTIAATDKGFETKGCGTWAKA